MARRTDRTDKTPNERLPAEIFKFPQAGHADRPHSDQPAMPSNLSPAEQRLFDELLALARTLDKRGVPGVYGQVAAIADQVTALNHSGQNTIAAIARGLDSLKKIEAKSTDQRLSTIRGIMSDHDLSIFFAALSLLASIGAVILGFAESREYFAYSIFWLALAVVLVLPTLWHIKTKR